MIDIANLYLDDYKPVTDFAMENTATYKSSLDAGHYYNKIDKERNSTPTRLKDFVFPRPPQVQSVRPLSTSSLCNGTSDSDTQSDSDCRCRPRTRPKRSSPIAIHTSSGSFSTTHQEILSSSSPMTFQPAPSFLPPIGVFWDIENCNVPKGCSAVLVAQVIRDSFFEGYREAEFLVVCDVTKEPSKVIQELNDAQVNLIHVPSLHKNAADEKLRQSMRRFADIHGSPAAVVLITSDINFISDVSDLRHRRKIHVILLHRDDTSESLILCANEHHNIVRLFESLPQRETKSSAEPYQITVYNIPVANEPARIKSRLKRISDNCGGRVVEVLPSGVATIHFSTKDLAQRAQKRMSGADVFGNKITVGAPARLDRRAVSTPTKSGTTTYVVEEQRTYVSGTMPQHVVSAQYSATTSSAVFTTSKIDYAGSWTDKRQLGGQISNGHDNNPADYVWNKPVSSGMGKKVAVNGRDRSPDKFRPVRKHQQDNDNVLMPPPIPGTNRKPYNQSQQNQIPVIVNHVAPRRVSPYTVGGGKVGGVKVETGLWSLPPGSTSPYSLASDDDERFFHPIPTTPKTEAIDLTVSNLDQSIETKDTKKILMAVFSEHVVVLRVSVYVQSDGNLAAHVLVPSLADAQFAISQLHRRKVGSKRILITYSNVGGPSPQLVRSQIVSLLVEVPGHRLPLFKFCELFESRYKSSISVSDIYKMKDVCLVTVEKSGRMICLNPDHRNTPSPAFNSSQESMELPYCSLHVKRPVPDKGWAEQEVEVLPNVRIGLQVLTYRIHTLVQSHKGCLPLPSLPLCYESQFHPLEVDETGVPLEHLVSCIVNVDIYQGVGCVKYLRWVNATKGEGDDPAKCVSPHLAQQQGLLSRELVDLLKMYPHCQLLFTRFIPAYHHHFGRQCRVADYGYTKLVDLLEALPNVVQVMGEGNKRVITLAHKAQVRRFTSDLLRVLKSQASKQVLLSEFADTFQRVINKEWDVRDYGVCDIADMLGEVSQSLFVVTQMDNDVLITFPKREQTPTEVSRTKKFADEVIELLSHAPQCSMLFSKFVSAYHHHFGYQCRVADYGFTKLLDLFEAIPHIVKIDGLEGERRVSLTEEESLKVLVPQIAMILHNVEDSTMLLADLPAAFKCLFGFALQTETYGCSSIMQLMQLLGDTVRMSDSGYAGPMVQLLRPACASVQALKVWRVLMEDGARLCMTSAQFDAAYWRCYKEAFAFARLADFPDVVQVLFAGGELIVQLTAVMSFAGDVYHLLFASGGRLPLASLEREYCARYGRQLQPTQYSHPTLESLLAAVGDVAAVTLDAGQKVVSVNRNLAKIGVKMPGDKMTDGGMPNTCLNELIAGFSLFDVKSPQKHSPPRNFAIDLPPMGLPKFSDHSISQLYSPAAGLMTAYKSQPASCVPLNIIAPAANQLPMPTAFADAGQMVVDERDSDGILANCEQMYSMLTNGNDSHGDNSLDMNSSGNSTPTRIRRKKRLAALFSTPIKT